MRRNRQRLYLYIIGILIAVLCFQTAVAAELIDPGQKTDVTIQYHDGALNLPNAKFDLYKVADVDAYSRMTLASSFEPYGQTVSGLASLNSLDQNEWFLLANTLEGYVLQDSVAPDAAGSTGTDGKLSVTVDPGLYLVIGYRVSMDDGYTYYATPFMLFLPSENVADDTWNYDVTVTPKFEKEYIPPEEDETVSRKVLKVWEDDGYESSRPESIRVMLLCDGRSYDTRTLNAGNNWRYEWDDLPAGHDWSVTEFGLSDYRVSVQRMGTTFVVTNRYVTPQRDNPPEDKPPEETVPEDKPPEETVPDADNPPEDNPPPQDNPPAEEVPDRGTPDDNVVPQDEGETPRPKLPQTGLLWWPIPIALAIGIIFVIVGVLRRRKKDK